VSLRYGDDSVGVRLVSQLWNWVDCARLSTRKRIELASRVDLSLVRYWLRLKGAGSGVMVRTRTVQMKAELTKAFFIFPMMLSIASTIDHRPL
jgi:hypothetical protein